LAGLAKLVNDGTATFENKTITLNVDIMLNDTTEWEDWIYSGSEPTYLWIPIGNSTNSFKGTFEGNKHIVSGLFYDNNTQDNIGLFGYISSSSVKINQLGVVAFYIYGNNNVGGIAGASQAQISNSYSRGIVKGYGNVGGLVGVASYYGLISSCYSTSIVSGDNYVGGLVGYLANSTTINSYSTGKAEGTRIIGGLVGSTTSGTVTNSYYDSQTSGQTDTDKGTPKTTAEMQAEAFVTTLGSAFKYNPSGYPKLAWEN